MKCVCACGREFKAKSEMAMCWSCQNRAVRRAIYSKRPEKKIRKAVKFRQFLSRWESGRPFRLTALERESYLSIAQALTRLQFPVSAFNFSQVAEFLAEADNVERESVLDRRIDHVAISLDRLLR